MKKNVLFICTLLFVFYTYAQEYKEVKDVYYYPESTKVGSDSLNTLDVYYPTKGEGLPTVIWFHGGGLTEGQKEIPLALKDKDFIVVGGGYRLVPSVSVDSIIYDAAQVVKWTYEHIEEYGGDPKKIIISGHSAGGYLALMIGMNKDYLDEVGVDNQELLGLVPFSPHTITHFTERKLRGIDELRPVVDSLAPLYWVTNEAPPITLITGDREMEMLGRYEENAYLARMLKLAKHPYIKLYELQGYGHNMTHPGFPILVNEIRNMLDFRDRDK